MKRASVPLYVEQHKRPSRRRWRPWLFTGLLLAVLCLLAWIWSETLLSAMGRFLVVQGNPRGADVIVVLGGNPTERGMEAAELYHEGWAGLVAITTVAPHPFNEELRRRQVVVPREEENTRTILLGLGVAAADVVVIESFVDSTRMEAEVVRDWLHEHGHASALIVTSPYHSRRTRQVYRKVFSPEEIDFEVIACRVSEFEPGTWWHQWRTLRLVVIEYQKLVLYSLGILSS